ncbi:DUF6624 domain-containing protein [Streptomyces sp. NPDC001941]|uniref:DUF6624 domain-containing protein n=1 Tax=Streptomyces sp. NPDC001941 TaxID=3154659 RepID=UPI00332DAD0B
MTLRSDLAAELRRRAAADQEARHRYLDTGEFDDLPGIDTANTAWIKAVIAEHGWPGTDLVGERGADDAWLLVQHADRDLAFQRAALEHLAKAVDADQAPARHLAYLTDRVLVADGQPQVYGTQYTEENGRLMPRPVRDPDHLDERRAAAGLESAAAYDQRMRQAYPR